MIFDYVAAISGDNHRIVILEILLIAESRVSYNALNKASTSISYEELSNNILSYTISLFAQEQFRKEDKTPLISINGSKVTLHRTNETFNFLNRGLHNSHLWMNHIIHLNHLKDKTTKGSYLIEEGLVSSLFRHYPMEYEITPKDSHCYDFFFLTKLGMTDLLAIDNFLNYQSKIFNESGRGEFIRFLELLFRREENMLSNYCINDKTIKTVFEWLEREKLNLAQSKALRDQSIIKLKWLGSKSDLIRIATSLFDSKLIECVNEPSTLEKVVSSIGKNFGLDLTGTHDFLSKALNTQMESNLKVFNKLIESVQKRYFKKLEK